MNNIKEGDLYKLIKIDNQEFEIKYGYYIDSDRYSKYNEPIPIYPDFINNPTFNIEGFPFVTHMQDKCIYYKGNSKEDSCYKCLYFNKVEDLIGICTCSNNMKKK